MNNSYCRLKLQVVKFNDLPYFWRRKKKGKKKSWVQVKIKKKEVEKLLRMASSKSLKENVG